MFKLSKNIQRIEESATMAITARSKAMKKAGEDVITLSVGEPDFDTPAHIVAAAKEALDAGFTRYTPASGTPDLRAAWAEFIGQRRGITYQPNQLIVTNGGKQAIYNVVAALVDSGDEVIIPAPYWVSYTEQVRAVGGVPVILQTTVEKDFKLEPDALREAITDRTRLLILNSPSNPTGAVYSRDELTALAEVLVEKQIPVLSDEVYEVLLYGQEFTSIASLGAEIYDLTIIVHSMSKTYAMTGWRIGCAVGAPKLIGAVGRLQSHSTSGANSVAQKAALAAITADQGFVDEMCREFEKRCAYMIKRLKAMPGVVCSEPRGAFYAFPQVSSFYGRSYGGEVINGSLDFCRLLLEHAKIATVPGMAFGNDEHIRIAYSTSMENITESLNRLEKFLSEIE